MWSLDYCWLLLLTQFFYEFLPTFIKGIYLIYAAVATVLLVFITALNMLGKKSPKHKKAINYLKDTNKELNEVADKSESILNAIGDGVVLIDGENTIKLFNPAAAQILGWNADDAVGLIYNSVLKLIDDSETEISVESNIIQQTINANSEMRPPTLIMKTKNDKKILVSLVASPIGEAGQGVIVVFRDVTKEKADEREQAEFISTASHEMRTPVASIEGYLGLVLNPATATIDARATDYIQKAQASAKHLGGLFQDLLDISRADDNRLTNAPEVTDVVAFTKSVVDDLQVKATEKNLDLIFKPSETTTAGMTKIQPIFYANVDHGHLRELISNLTENAIKYTPQGSVIIDVNGDSDHVVISVKDTGIGIPSEDLPHLFQKFYRVDNKETNEIGGTGLGLYLVRKLAEILQGRVWAESEYGKGSTFFIEIPRLNAQESQQLRTAAPVVVAEPIVATEPTPVAGPAPELPSSQKESSPMSNYSVPRGDVLTPEQKAAYVAKLQQINQNNQNGGQ